MSIVNTLALESIRQIKINFDGGDLSSDAGLLLIKEFVSKLGIEQLLNCSFKANDSAVFRYHTDKDNLLQMIYMIIAGYFEDDDTLKQLLGITRILRKRIYSIQLPQAIILDLDSTLLEAYGKQEDRDFNFHYQSNGYHPFKTAEDCCKGSAFSKIYHIQAV